MSDKILLHTLGYGFCTQQFILAYFCQIPLPSKASEIICAKAALLWRQKLLVKFTSDALTQ